MNRRDALLALLALGAGCGVAGAQSGPARLAYIGSGTAAGGAWILADLRDGLRENGLAEGRDYILDSFWSDGHYDRFPGLLVSARARASPRSFWSGRSPRRAPRSRQRKPFRS